MERQRSLGEYKAIDLIIFAVITAVVEYLTTVTARVWFPDQLYTVSPAAIIASVVYMRWGAWGGIHAALSGFIFCLLEICAAHPELIR